MSATGRYKAFPVAGLALMAVGLLLLSQLDAGSSRADRVAGARSCSGSASGWSRRS